MNKEISENNGGETDYYKLKPSWIMAQDIIEDREMNFSQGNIFKSAFAFNVGRHSGTDYIRELNKIVYFAERELARISPLKVVQDTEKTEEFYDVNFQEYSEFIKYACNEIEYSTPHIVSFFRGSLPMSTHISNKLKCPLSIGKFQSYDSDDKDFELIFNNNIAVNETIILIDDLEDSGLTFLKAQEYFAEHFPNNKVISLAMFAKKNSNIKFFKEKPDKWLRFWWEL